MGNYVSYAISNEMELKPIGNQLEIVMPPSQVRIIFGILSHISQIMRFSIILAIQFAALAASMPLSDESNCAVLCGSTSDCDVVGCIQLSVRSIVVSYSESWFYYGVIDDTTRSF
ncbi:hypothetical protein CY34DRAFT_812966 [Suillus luteus UH-Slu-Lm8-n1]|uniref:Uncharacterized protein n=1 Tax=Suillus luteus UH-Slu-Lm8-n1 TaxID=930992 RepID=A0A0D0AJG1_9AGAM|nr:hypothetical protein CY34DRAFT_812966 [Suillus luteus UH-Slu-Lm8-n1]